MTHPRQTVSFLKRRFREVGIAPDTRHGQNFLIDLNLIELLVRCAELSPRDLVVEVGTGTGSLTAMLAAAAGHVVTAEISAELHQLASEELIDHENITMLHLDALRNKNNLAPELLAAIRKGLEREGIEQYKLVANLPYNIATPVISNLLVEPPLPALMAVTIQKELAERIAARPGTKDFGALSVWVQCQCDVELVRVLPPTVFWPKPKVHSAILKIVPRPERRAALPDPTAFHEFVRTIFLHRRKFLRGVLLAAFKKQLGKEPIDQVLTELKLAPDARAEQLSIEQLLELSLAMGRRMRERCVD